MSVKIQRLVGPVQVANAATAYYTAQVATRFDKVVVSNPDTTNAYTIAFYVVPAGSAADAAHDMVPTKTIQPLESVDITQLEGLELNATDALYAIASSANQLNLLISGVTLS